MVRQEGQIRRSPEERTAAFFQYNPDTLVDSLLAGDGMIIALPGTDRKIRIVAAQPWPKRMVGQRYKNTGIASMEPGDLWNPSMRTIRQSLIVAKDENGVGACVRLLQSEYWDSANNTFVTKLTEGDQDFAGREGDIASYFGLQRNERSRLQFLDDSDILYIVRGTYDIATNSRNQGITPDYSLGAIP